MPDPSTSTMTVVKAVTGIIDAQYLEGVQKFNHLWRIYFKTLGSREQFLAQKTVLIKGKMVSLHQQSPEEQTEKLTIKGLPLSIGNKEVKDFLLSKNIKPLSRVMYSYIRDDDGARTGFKDGDSATRGVGWVSLPITKHFFSFRERKSRDEFSKSLFLHVNLILHLQVSVTTLSNERPDNTEQNPANKL